MRSPSHCHSIQLEPKENSELYNVVQKNSTMDSRMGNLGHPGETSDREDRAIGRLVLGTLEKRRTSSRELFMNLVLDINTRTVHQRLSDQCLKGFTAVQKPY